MTDTFELQRVLKRNGFTEAAKNTRKFAGRAKPQHIQAKLGQWKVWEAAGGWPWPQWDRVSEKDHYAVRESCPW